MELKPYLFSPHNALTRVFFPDGLNTISYIIVRDFIKLESGWLSTVNRLNFLLLRRSGLQFTIQVYDAIDASTKLMIH